MNIPQVIIEAFPLLGDATVVGKFELPDTTFRVVSTGNNKVLAMVTTDYADPQDQSRELKVLSGRYEFAGLIEPYSQNGKLIKVLEHDDMEGNFFVTVPHKNYKLYYYLAELTITIPPSSTNP